MKLTILLLSTRTNGEIARCASGRNRSHARDEALHRPDSSSMRPSQLHNAMHPRVSRGPAAHATPWMHAYPWEPVMRWWSRFPTLRRWSRRDIHDGGCAFFPRGDDTGPPGTPRGFCQHQQYATAWWTDAYESGPVGTEMLAKLNTNENAWRLWRGTSLSPH